jgi:hypothetical protein
VQFKVGFRPSQTCSWTAKEAGAADKRARSAGFIPLQRDPRRKPSEYFKTPLEANREAA